MVPVDDITPCLVQAMVVNLSQSRKLWIPQYNSKTMSSFRLMSRPTARRRWCQVQSKLQKSGQLSSCAGELAAVVYVCVFSRRVFMRGQAAYPPLLWGCPCPLVSPLKLDSVFEALGFATKAYTQKPPLVEAAHCVGHALN